MIPNILSYLITKDQFKTKPRHIETEAVYERLPGKAPEPEEGDPMRGDQH